MLINGITPQLINGPVKDFVLGIVDGTPLSREKIQCLMEFHSSGFYELYKGDWNDFVNIRKYVNELFYNENRFEVDENKMIIYLNIPYKLNFNLVSLLKLYFELSIGYELVDKGCSGFTTSNSSGTITRYNNYVLTLERH